MVEIIIAGSNIISICEELSYPYGKHPELATKIDKLAKDYKVTVLGTGVNPGFLMDALPLFITGVCQDVKEIRAVGSRYIFLIIIFAMDENSLQMD